MASLGKTLIETITSAEPAIRDRSVRELTRRPASPRSSQACEELEPFARAARTSTSGSGPLCSSTPSTATTSRKIRRSARPGLIPFDGFMDVMERRYEQAITAFRTAMRDDGPNGAICSALAQAYDQIAFQTLADQVRRSVRSCQGNRWMFRVGGVDEHPLRIHPRLLERESDDALYPILVERTPVRLDLSHSAWSDIFFLGMDYPEGRAGPEHLGRSGRPRPRRPNRTRPSSAGCG